MRACSSSRAATCFLDGQKQLPGALGSGGGSLGAHCPGIFLRQILTVGACWGGHEWEAGAGSWHPPPPWPGLQESSLAPRVHLAPGVLGPKSHLFYRVIFQHPNPRHVFGPYLSVSGASRGALCWDGAMGGRGSGWQPGGQLWQALAPGAVPGCPFWGVSGRAGWAREGH